MRISNFWIRNWNKGEGEIFCFVNNYRGFRISGRMIYFLQVDFMFFYDFCNCVRVVVCLRQNLIYEDNEGHSHTLTIINGLITWHVCKIAYMYFYYSLTHETQLKTLILKLSDPNLTSSLRWYIHDYSLIYKEMTCIE